VCDAALAAIGTISAAMQMALTNNFRRGRIEEVKHWVY